MAKVRGAGVLSQLTPPKSAPKPPAKRTSLMVPVYLHTRLKAASNYERLSVWKLTIKLLTEGLDRMERVHGDDFRYPNPNS